MCSPSALVVLSEGKTMNHFYTDIDCMKRHVGELENRKVGVLDAHVGDIFTFDFKSGRSVRLAVKRRIWKSTGDEFELYCELCLTSACTHYGLTNILDLEAYVRDQVLGRCL
jgi:hypothetical protein